MKVALITGATGQDGAYLAEFLVKKGYEVHGIKRRTSLFNNDRIARLCEDPHAEQRRFILDYGKMADPLSLLRVIQKVRPGEVYNLAAQSHMAVGFEVELQSCYLKGIAAARFEVLILEPKTSGDERGVFMEILRLC
jgi:GDPmannose 4,6-dehydratase